MAFNLLQLGRLRPCLAGKPDQHLAERRAIRDPLRKIQPQRGLAVLHVEAFGVAAGAAPVAIGCAEQLGRLMAHSLAVAGILMRDRPLLRLQ